MSLSNPNKIVTEERLAEFYQQILPFLGGTSMVSSGGASPIGQVISIMGITAPSGYLACDGTVYNITDYPDLADYFEAQFGSKNQFGGDGTTTFAVPDLRGEFLRGTGTNSHTDQGAGSNVGEHQDATRHPYFYGNSTGALVFVGGETTTSSGNDVTPANADTVKDGKNQRRITSVMNSTLTTTHKFYFSRPTNTSVLYCIKAVSDGYSTDEKIVGTWIDGKPVYQKTFTHTISSPSSDTWDDIGDLPNVDTVVGYIGSVSTNNFTLSTNYYANPAVDKSRGKICVYHKGMAGHDMCVTIQYTKTTD